MARLKKRLTVRLKKRLTARLKKRLTARLNKRLTAWLNKRLTAQLRPAARLRNTVWKRYAARLTKSFLKSRTSTRVPIISKFEQGKRRHQKVLFWPKNTKKCPKMAQEKMSECRFEAWFFMFNSDLKKNQF